ncbi:MAG: NirD/YgiW/YdeI family stress tolerance protein [Shewanella sp.]|nr:NirD/YgiW/YdeI family stress tolerance protein [Shewanella sp.]MCF1431373.1 NirD/YgiW/YdeI family stress tolerance protein [Shewanella sp.]MCF1439135.1 NirD/YgiW/YdeI family stress tolerance protein [Shewanella sp.]MCF1458268.1 NirD/YgiW/YdeI family stress tolerance protein [Shewanella sp.]
MSNKTAVVLLFVSLVSGGAMAAYEGPGSKAKITSASAVKGASDGAKIQLTGKLVKSLGGEKYQFQDKSGMVIVDIDDDLLRNIQLDEKTPVVLVGEVDNDLGGQEVDIEVISLLDEASAAGVHSHLH